MIGLAVLSAAQFAMPSSSEIETMRKLSLARTNKIEQILAHQRPSVLKTFEKCLPGKARMTGIDWYSVSWECPVGQLRKGNTAAFKFRPNSNEIIDVVVTTTPEIVVKPNG